MSRKVDQAILNIESDLKTLVIQVTELTVLIHDHLTRHGKVGDEGKEGG